MQVPTETGLAERVLGLVDDELPRGRTIGAWRSLLRAHATSSPWAPIALALCGPVGSGSRDGGG